MRWKALVLIVAACSFERAPLGGDGGGPAVPDTGPGDPDAMPPPQPDADPLAPDATPCVEGCTGDGDVRLCRGGEEQIIPCAVGCGPTPAPHCQAVVPSNEPQYADRLAMVPETADLVITADDTVDDGGHWELFTDTGRIYDAITMTEVRPALVGDVDANGIGFWARDDGVGVLVVDSLTVEDRAKLWVYGSRALLVLSRNDVVINGQIDLTAGVCPDAIEVGAHCPGPGGGFGSTVTGIPTGCGPGEDGQQSGGNETGGGGGSFGSIGGNGANGLTPSEVGGTGGSIVGCPGNDLVPLMGGSGGGWGGGGNGNGGGGGGAIQITSQTRITIAVVTPLTPVGVWAGGMGGLGGGLGNGGGGGGSGGGVLLEAPVISISTGSWLAANGGGGGAGNAADALANGALGRFDGVMASGGTTGRAGGNGAAGPLPATGGTGGGDGTGGGGGGGGIVRLNGVVTGADVTTCSPTASFGDVVLE